MRIVDKKLCQSYQGRPCIICGRHGVGHHVKSKGSGGDDTPQNLMPLCQNHHVEVHAKGLQYFAMQYPSVKSFLEYYGYVRNEITGAYYLPKL
jgi:5-methylcytosine-specific restriction endonuclease McrA